MVMIVEWTFKSGRNTSQGESQMLIRGSIVLSIWCVINFILAFVILCYVIVLKKDSPILQVASFSEVEISSLGTKTIAALNAFTILYNSCSLVISVLTWPLIRKNLIAGQKSAFWMLVLVIGFVEVMAFFASSYIGHGRWQVNVIQGVLYLVGIGLSGGSLFKGDNAKIQSVNPQNRATHPN
jgi:hypothetical protein